MWVCRRVRLWPKACWSHPSSGFWMLTSPCANCSASYVHSHLTTVLQVGMFITLFSHTVLFFDVEDIHQTLLLYGNLYYYSYLIFYCLQWFGSVCWASGEHPASKKIWVMSYWRIEMILERCHVTHVSEWCCIILVFTCIFAVHMV